MSAPERIEGDGAALSIWREAPSLNGARTAALGAFSCDAPAHGADLIGRATMLLKAEGFSAVLGPMDGDTWSSHRLVVESDGSPPFLMEPHNPEHYPAAFEDAGFSVVSRYLSSDRPTASPPAARRHPPGVHVRNLDKSRGEEELARLHALSLEAFTHNAFYQPISAERFIASYAPVMGFVDPELVLFAEDANGELQGFLFGIPNYAEGPTPQAVILKTYASRAKGLGSLLADEFHRRAYDKGFTRVIHALMHESNVSARHSDKLGGRIFRRYALWGLSL
ncbi:MAG: hypothetical protein ABUL73_06500 [Alphaproteobacteria bacterium]